MAPWCLRGMMELVGGDSTGDFKQPPHVNTCAGGAVTAVKL